MWVLLVLTACGAHRAPARVDAGPPAVGQLAPAAPSSIEGLARVETGTGLVYYVLRPGTGASPIPGQMVQVHYTGWLEKNGKKFDSSLDRGRPIEFPVAMGVVIKGWDQGVLTMKVGERRQLRIPAPLGYGDKGAGNAIPPGAALIFEVDLVGLR